MTTNSNRRIFLKGTLTATLVGAAVGSGLLKPGRVLAAWPKEAFSAKDFKVAVKDAMGGEPTPSKDITVKAPDIAENGAVVPVTVESSLKNVESIAIVVEQNPTPLAAVFNLGPTTEANISTRIKMGKTSNVLAVVKADGKLYSAAKEVKVTIGGCGG